MGRFDKTKYDRQFVKDNYDVICLQVPKGRKQELKDIAAANGISVNKFINNCIENNLKDYEKNRC